MGGNLSPVVQRWGYIEILPFVGSRTYESYDGAPDPHDFLKNLRPRDKSYRDKCKAPLRER